MRDVARSRAKVQDEFRDHSLDYAIRKLSSKVDERDDDTDRILDLPVNGDGCGQVEYRLEINRHEKRGLAERGYALP